MAVEGTTAAPLGTLRHVHRCVQTAIKYFNFCSEKSRILGLKFSSQILVQKKRLRYFRHYPQRRGTLCLIFFSRGRSQAQRGAGSSGQFTAPWTCLTSFCTTLYAQLWPNTRKCPPEASELSNFQAYTVERFQVWSEKKKRVRFKVKVLVKGGWRVWNVRTRWGIYVEKNVILSS